VQGEFGVADHTEGGLSVGAAKEILRGAKLRCTAARIAVLQQLAARSTPLSHQEVTDSLAEFGFDQSTIYRSLSEMADVGLRSVRRRQKANLNIRTLCVLTVAR
jgi:Fe2+ or Zn2+ uptake regulation protein